MTSKPPSSGPSMFSAGTTTFSNVMYAVPAAVEYEVLICLVSTPSPRGTRKTVRPPSVCRQDQFTTLGSEKRRTLAPTVYRERISAADHQITVTNEVVGVHPTSDPLLCPIDGPARYVNKPIHLRHHSPCLPVLALLRRRSQSGHVRPRKCLRNS